MKRVTLLVLVVLVITSVAVAQPTTAPPVPRQKLLLEHLLPVSLQFLAMYPDEPVADVTLVDTMRRLIEVVNQHTQTIRTLQTRVVRLEALLAEAEVEESAEVAVDPNGGGE